MALQITLEDRIGCETVLFEWAESYDSKDWERLKRCLAPSLRIDYRAFVNKLWEDIPAAEFVAMISNPHFLGNPRIHTQHLIGVTKWEKVSETQILGHHQMRVAHQKYADDGLKEGWTEFGGEDLFGAQAEEESNVQGGTSMERISDPESD